MLKYLNKSKYIKNKNFIKNNKRYINIITWNTIKDESKKIFENQYNKNTKSILLLHEYYDNSDHSDNDSKINITKLLNKYNISSEQFLESIYLPLYKIYNQPKKWVIPLDSINVLDINNYNIDILYDIHLNIKFRKNNEEEQIINIEQFDQLHGKGKFYNLSLSMLNSKYKYDGYLSIYDECTINKIKNICDEINLSSSCILQDIFINHTIHTNQDRVIDITKLLDIYNISSGELFCYMYNLNISDINKKLMLKDAKNILEQRKYSIDTFNNVFITNNFRKDKNDKQYIYMTHFDRDNNKSFYYCILSLLNVYMTNV